MELKITTKDLGRRVIVNGLHGPINFNDVPSNSYKNVYIKLDNYNEACGSCNGKCPEGYGVAPCDELITLTDDAKPEDYESYSALNSSQAEKHIGKIMEFGNMPEVLKQSWVKGTLEKVRKSEYGLFKPINDYMFYYYLRACPETFTAPQKQKQESIIPALEKSWKQWQLMAWTGMDKEDAYMTFGGEHLGTYCTYCFLCDYCDVSSSGYDDCNKCIHWGSQYSNTCFEDGTAFDLWREHGKSRAGAQAMADFLLLKLNEAKSQNK